MLLGFATNDSNSRHLMPLVAKLNVNLKRENPTDLTGAVAIVASVGDEQLAIHHGAKATILCEHGVGQSYVCDRIKPNSAWAPGRSRPKNRVLFLAPNQFAADRHRSAHPTIPTAAVGSFFLDQWAGYVHKRNSKPTVAISTHWNCRATLETMSAWPWVRQELTALAACQDFKLIGHYHPFERQVGTLDAKLADYEAAGVEVVHRWEDVLAVADCYIADNTSTLYEFAATGRPVVVLNPPWYRRNVHHGLRFWNAIPGVEVNHLKGIVNAVRLALADPPNLKAKRQTAIAKAYAPLDGQAVTRAVQVIKNLMDRPASAS